MSKESAIGLLVALMDYLEKVAKSELAVSLQIGGFIVTGFLADRKSYISAFLTQFGIKKTLEEILAQDDEPENEMPGASDLDYSRNIYLRNARIFGGSVPIPTAGEGIWWLGKLSSVDAFILGHLTQEQK